MLSITGRVFIFNKFLKHWKKWGLTKQRTANISGTMYVELPTGAMSSPRGKYCPSPKTHPYDRRKNQTGLFEQIYWRLGQQGDK